MNNIDPKLLATKDPKKLMETLSDKEALAKMLSSPQAQTIMKMLSGKGKNG